MEFQHKYHGSSSIRQMPGATALSFAPDVLRDPTYFVGSLGRQLIYREAMSALHAVVKSDLRFKPADKTDYKAWVAEQEQYWLAEHMAQQPDLRGDIATARVELEAIQAKRKEILGPYYQAQNKFRQHMWKHDYDARWVLDPVITVHPDELFFECFSQDESTYGKLSLDYNQFERIDTFACGTTNVDYSEALYTEFQKIRNYKNTELRVEPAGFTVATEQEETYKEEKIDLPDSWVRGFLQVSTAMTLPAATFELHPTDLANMLFVLRRHRARTSPRYIRFQLRPGEPVRMVFEPWGTVVDCPRSKYTGEKNRDIKLWGRRRLLMLERLLPITESVKIHLLGDGLPSFFLLGLGGMTFTLGLSGWTDNNWSQAGQFNLLTAQVDYTRADLDRSYRTLKSDWLMTTDELVTATGYERAMVHGLMSEHAREGNVIYDISKGVYRARELSKDGFPLEEIRYVSDVEQEAFLLVATEEVTNINRIRKDGQNILIGDVSEGSTLYNVEVRTNDDLQLIGAQCQCSQFKAAGIKKGPCKHMIALRMQAGT